MDIYGELREQLTRAAEHLTGVPCTVRFRAPCRSDALAVCFKSGGRAVIDIDMSVGMDTHKLLVVLCHEAAHVKQLWHEWIDVPDLPSKSVRFSKEALALPVAKQIEDDADTLAKKWLKYVDANAHRYAVSGDDLFSASLRALANMP